MLRDPAPTGDVGWAEDLGTQPAPPWLPAVWRTLVQITPAVPEAGAVQVELYAFDAGRVLVATPHGAARMARSASS